MVTYVTLTILTYHGNLSLFSWYLVRLAMTLAVGGTLNTLSQYDEHILITGGVYILC